MKSTLIAVALSLLIGVARGAEALPKLVDVGARTCIPCKEMAPILEGLKKEFAGEFDVVFIDTSEKENIAVARKLNVTIIPTQIFYDASGKELFRHEGFYGKDDILARWKALNYDFGAAAPAMIERLEPVKADSRPKEQICYMCEHDNDVRTLITLKTPKGDVRLCGSHCYFILFSCMTEDKAGIDARVSVADWSTGEQIPASRALYLHSAEEVTGRPAVRAFADRESAMKERQSTGGSLLTWRLLMEKELATRCGFCDRACYPEDAARVRADGLHTFGCCSHCAMGVTARTGKDIEVHQPDALTGDMLVVKTLNGAIASIEPPTAVAWFGQRKNAEGKWVSAGCFHQGFFTSQENLRKWLDAHPAETGRQITIQQALSDKLKLTPQQIQKACKIGECAPK